jgi:two-component system chemotaxis response regulator CheY
MKILIVDDSKTMRMIVARTLRQAGFDGHTMQEAANGAEALQVIRSNKPDVVLSDWNMPGMSGPELLAAVNAEGHRVHFGFVTSENTPEMRDKAAEAGAQFFISKPFTAENFQQALKRVVGA